MNRKELYDKVTLTTQTPRTLLVGYAQLLAKEAKEVPKRKLWPEVVDHNSVSLVSQAKYWQPNYSML